MTTETEEFCRTCGKPKSNHPYRHAFVGSSDSPAIVQVDLPTPPPPDSSPDDPVRDREDRVRVNPPSGGDPILRMALMRAGVITLAQLEEVEAELKGAGVAFHSEAMGQPRDR